MSRRQKQQRENYNDGESMKKKTKEVIDQIKKMGTKTEDFFEVYKVVSDKYWTFDNPDEFQQAAKALVMLAERGGDGLEDEVIVTIKLASEIIKMKKANTGAAMGHLGFTDGTKFTFKIYQTQDAMKDFEHALAMVNKSIKNGTIGFKNNPQRS